MNPLLRAMLRNAVGLALFACVTVGVIAVTEVGTRDAIAEQQREARRRALLEILPASSFDNAILDDAVSVADPRLGQSGVVQALIARRDGAPVAAVVPLRVADGYSGAIRLIVGIRPDGTLAGVRVVEHRETPGLGDAIEARKSDWIESFRDRGIGDPPASQWSVRKDGGAFDAFTGATITPRAVVRGVYRTLEWFADEGRIQLFPGSATTGLDAASAPAPMDGTRPSSAQTGTTIGPRPSAPPTPTGTEP